MKMKISRFLSLLFLYLTTCSFYDPPGQKTSRPNILIILTDQWRGQALGILKAEGVKTPNLDSFAARALVCNQAITNYPLCSPSRATILTGKYPLQHKVYSNVNSASTPYGVELPPDMITWSDILKDNGYANGYIGKWHLDSPYKPYIATANNKGNTAWNEWTPPARRHGFDFWYAYGTYDDHNRPMYWETDAGREEFHFVDQWSPEHEADKAIGFLKNSGGKYRDPARPFSLVVSVNPPHSEYKKVPARYVDLYKDMPLEKLLSDPDIPAAGTEMGDLYRENIKYYYACMSGVDDQVGRIFKQLRQSGLDKNTIIIFMADHGNCLGKHDQISKNTFYEESVRIPFIVNWSGHISPGVDNELLFSAVDIYPTLLGLVSLPNPSGNRVDGSDLSSYFLNRRGNIPDLQFFMGAVNAANKNSGFRGIRTAKYKLVYEGTGNKQKRYLFDIGADPFELKNIYTRSSTVASDLERHLKKWLDKTDDPYILNGLH